jgi:hypothetical protein
MTAETETARFTGTTRDEGGRRSWELAADRSALLAAVERIRSEVENGVGEGEVLMTLPAATVAALAETGLFRMKLPRVLGGLEADLLTQYEVIEAMAYVDASAAWCLMIGASSIAIPGAFLPDAAVADVFHNQQVPLAASSFVPTGSATQTAGGISSTVDGRSRAGCGTRTGSASGPWCPTGNPRHRVTSCSSCRQARPAFTTTGIRSGYGVPVAAI